MSPSTTAPHASPAARPAQPAHSAGNAAASRPRPAHGGASPEGAGSPFAQLLQGAVDEDSGEATAPDAGDAPHERRAADKPHAAADGTDAAAQPPASPEQLPGSTELNAALRRAGLLASARGKAAGIDAGGRHPGAGRDALERAGDSAADRASGGAALPAAHEDRALASAGSDLAGLQPVLDAPPISLVATAEAAPAAAGGEFSLTSLGAAGAAPAAPAPPPAPPAQATLAPPPGSAAFPTALGAQLNTWLKDGVQYATLELNPQEMGPIDVRIALQGGRTDIQLGADVAATRAALAEALPQLAEALGDVGLSLAGGSVSDQTGQHARQGAAEGQQRAFALPGWLAPARDDAAASAAAGRPAPRGLVDLVA